MKTIYLFYAILFKNVSIVHLNNKAKNWCAAHDKPQDGYGGHSGLWIEASTPAQAVWNLYHR